jgi:hypothetical protein
LKERAVDALFLGGMFKEGVEGAGLDTLKKQVLEAARVRVLVHFSQVSNYWRRI